MERAPEGPSQAEGFRPDEISERARAALESPEKSVHRASENLWKAKLLHSRVSAALANLRTESDPLRKAQWETKAQKALEDLESLVSGKPVLIEYDPTPEETRAERVRDLRDSIDKYVDKHARDPVTDTLTPERREALEKFATAFAPSIAEARPATAPGTEASQVPSTAVPDTQPKSSGEIDYSQIPRFLRKDADEQVGSHTSASVPEVQANTPEEDLVLTDGAPPEPAVASAVTSPAETAPVDEDPLAKTKRAFEESRAALRAAEKERAEQEKEYVSKTGAVMRGVHSLLGKNKNRFKDSEEKMNAAASAHAQKLETYLSAVLASKTERKWGAQDRRDRILARFAQRDLVSKGEIAIAEAHQEAKQGKESNMAVRALEWVSDRNAWFDRKFKNKYVARTMRTLAFSAAGAGIATAFGAVALPGTFGYFAWRFAKGMGIGIGVGDTAGAAYNEFLGKRAARNLKREQGKLRGGLGSTDAGQIAKLRSAYRRGNAEAIARKRRNVEAAASFIAGAGWTLEQLLTDPAIPAGGAHESVSASHSAMQPNGPSLQEGIPQTHAPTGEMPQLQSAIPQPAEIPHLDVQAGTGHGYEWMAKQLAGQLHSQHIDVSHLDPKSDLRMLADAMANPDPHAIDQAVQKIATTHHFFQVGSERNVLIRPDMHMTFDAHGQLHIAEPGHADVIDAPKDAPTTPPYHPESAGQESAAPMSENAPASPAAQPAAGAPSSVAQAAPTSAETSAVRSFASERAASAAAIGASTAVLSGGAVERIPSAANDNVPASPESVVKVSVDKEGRNLISGGSEKEREDQALKLAKERPLTAFMFTKKVRRGGFLGLFSREEDAWFMAYADQAGAEPQIYDTVNDHDWRAVNFGTSTAAPAPAEEERKAA